MSLERPWKTWKKDLWSEEKSNKSNTIKIGDLMKLAVTQFLVKNHLLN